MPVPSHLATTPDDIEHAFYEGLLHADVEQIMACWAEHEDVVCIPPGGKPLHGLLAIRKLFTDLILNGPITLHITHTHKSLQLAQAIHTVTEHVSVQTDEGQAVAQLYSLNVFHKTAQGWRLVAHHTSPGHITDGSVEPHALPSTVLH